MLSRARFASCTGQIHDTACSLALQNTYSYTRYNRGSWALRPLVASSLGSSWSGTVSSSTVDSGVFRLFQNCLIQGNCIRPVVWNVLLHGYCHYIVVTLCKESQFVQFLFHIIHFTKLHMFHNISVLFVRDCKYVVFVCLGFFLITNILAILIFCRTYSLL